MSNPLKVKMMNKYHAKRTFLELCQRTFASKAECVRGEELRLMEMASEVTHLEYQPSFELCRKPKIAITLDFSYRERLYDDPIVKAAGDKVKLYGGRIYEDVKGVLTRDSRTKLAWLKEKYGIDVVLIR